MSDRKLSRRTFLTSAGAALAGAALAACGGTPAPTPTARVVEVTKVVDKPVTQIVEKPVTQIVEKQVTQVVPTPKTVKVRQLVKTLWWDNVVPGYREEPMRKWDDTQDEYTFLYEWTPSYRDKLVISIAGGQPPDLFIIEYAWLAEMLKANALLDIKPLIDRDKYPVSDFPKNAIDGYTYKGGIYGLPDNITAWCIYYNKDMFDKAGVSYPTNKWDDPKWTTDDFLATCDKLTKKDSSGKVVQWAMPISRHWLIEGIWMSLFGGQYVDDPVNPTKCTLDDPKAIQGYQFYADLQNKYGFAPQAEAMPAGTGELLQTGKLAMEIGGGWGVKGWMKYKFPYDIGHFPKGPVRRDNYSFMYPICIAKNSKVKEGAWSLLKYYEDVAIKDIIKLGNLQGTKLKDLRDIFMADKEGAPSRNVLVDAAERFGFRDPLLTNWGEIVNTIKAEMDPLFLGKKTAEECCKAAAAKATPLVAKGRIT